MSGEKKADDPAMVRVLEIWGRLQRDGWTQQRLGDAMGYPEASARKSVSQFMRSRDPQIGMLRRFAKATGVPLEQFVNQPERRPKTARKTAMTTNKKRFATLPLNQAALEALAELDHPAMVADIAALLKSGGYPEKVAVLCNLLPESMAKATQTFEGFNAGPWNLRPGISASQAVIG